jgi:hypothetical protein
VHPDLGELEAPELGEQRLLLGGLQQGGPVDEPFRLLLDGRESAYS